MGIPVTVQQLQKMLSHIGDVIVVIDKTGLIKFKSANVEQVFGWKPEELVGEAVWLNIHKDDQERVREFFGELLKSNGESMKIECRYRNKNGRYKWIQFTGASLLDDPDIEGVLGNYHDITERRITEEAIKESESRFKGLFQNLTSSSSLYKVVRDREGKPIDYRFIAVNPAYEKGIGLSQGELVGKGLLEVFPDTETVWLDTLEKVCETGEAIQLENYSQAVDRYFELIVYRPQINEIAMIGSDITDRKRNELELIKAKEMAEEGDRLKSAFLQNMSHEIRTPLNAICGFSNLLLKPDLEYKQVEKFVSVINNSSDQLLSIVNDILTISSLETKQEKVVRIDFNVNELLAELNDIFKHQIKTEGVTIHVENGFDDERSIIVTDKTKLTQILTNLISNAIKFTCSGSIVFGYQHEGEFLKFYVKDSGIGIHPKKHKSIFERFSQADKSITTKYGGSGLGLAISKGFAELLGGKIWVESEDGEGATFLFTIPYKGGIQNQFTNDLDRKLTNKGATILVAEDEELNLLFIKELFNTTNYQLICVSDGQEAVDTFNNRTDIDIVLMDIKMPNMDGYTAAGLIRKINPNIPIIAQTAYALENEVKKFEKVFDGYITKPIKADTLMEVIRKCK